MSCLFVEVSCSQCVFLLLPLKTMGTRYTYITCLGPDFSTEVFEAERGALYLYFGISLQKVQHKWQGNCKRINHLTYRTDKESVVSVTSEGMNGITMVVHAFVPCNWRLNILSLMVIRTLDSIAFNCSWDKRYCEMKISHSSRVEDSLNNRGKDKEGFSCLLFHVRLLLVLLLATVVSRDASTTRKEDIIVETDTRFSCWNPCLFCLSDLSPFLFLYLFNCLLNRILMLIDSQVSRATRVSCSFTDLSLLSDEISIFFSLSCPASNSSSHFNCQFNRKKSRTREKEEQIPFESYTSFKSFSSCIIRVQLNCISTHSQNFWLREQELKREREKEGEGETDRDRIRQNRTFDLLYSLSLLVVFFVLWHYYQ